MSSAIDSFRRVCRARASLSLALGVSLLSCALRAQSFKAKDLAPLQIDSSLAGRTGALDEIFHDYWQDKLKHSPEFASAIGDTRYDDQLSDYSARAYNDELARGEQFIDRLGAIDTAGMTEREKSRKDQLVRRLIDQQESSACKPWQTPVAQTYGIHLEFPKLAQTLSFNSADDYDRYVARLNKIPAAFAQITTDLSLGQEAGRSEPQATMQAVLRQANGIARVKPEDTAFARPVENFSADISPSQQAEIRKGVLTAIRTQVQPAYGRFAKYLSANYIPQSPKQIQGQPDSTANSGATCSVSSSARDFDGGRIEIWELRAAAEKALGKDFSLSAFHDEVQASAFLSPDSFHTHVETWIAQQHKLSKEQK